MRHSMVPNYAWLLAFCYTFVVSPGLYCLPNLRSYGRGRRVVRLLQRRVQRWQTQQRQSATGQAATQHSELSGATHHPG